MQKQKQLTLDPTNWEASREAAHKIIDETFDFFRSLESKRCWTPLPQEVKLTLKEKAPAKGKSLTNVYDDYKNCILNYHQGNIHPAHFAWIQGGGNLTSAIADFLSSAFNANVSIGDHAARYVEQQVLDWCREMFRLPQQSTGLLLSGSSMANLTAMVAAKNRALSQKHKLELLTIYCSTETHSCIQKAARNIGFKEDAIRYIAANNQCQVNTAELNKQIEADLAAGFIPTILIGNAGTVNTGAIDPLDELSQIARKYKLWLHIDGAYGLPACLCESKREVLENLSKADSWAFDFHKLFNINYDVGCVFVKEGELLNHAFTIKNASHHIYNVNDGIAGKIPSTDDIGFELSRSFKALKIWMTIKEFGFDHIVGMINEKLEQAKYLQQKIEEHPNLQLITAAQISIVTFQYVHNSLDETLIDNLNKAIVLELQQRGIAAPAITMVNNKTAIRVCITNHRTNTTHLDIMIKEIENVANNLIKTNKYASHPAGTGRKGNFRHARGKTDRTLQ